MPSPGTFKELVELFISIIKQAIPIVSGLALLLFLWGIIQFFFNQASEEAARKSKNNIFYGIIALFVMLSVWGIVTVLSNTFLG